VKKKPSRPRRGRAPQLRQNLRRRLQPFAANVFPGQARPQSARSRRRATRRARSASRGRHDLPAEFQQAPVLAGGGHGVRYNPQVDDPGIRQNRQTEVGLRVRERAIVAHAHPQVLDGRPSGIEDATPPQGCRFLLGRGLMLRQQQKRIVATRTAPRASLNLHVIKPFLSASGLEDRDLGWSVARFKRSGMAKDFNQRQQL